MVYSHLAYRDSADPDPATSPSQHDADLLGGIMLRLASFLPGLPRYARASLAELSERAWFNVRRPNHLTRWLTGLSVGVSLGTILLGAGFLWDMRNDTWQRAVQASDNLIISLSKDIARNVELLDLSLQGAQECWVDPRVHALEPDLMEDVLFDTFARANYLASMYITDATGNLVILAGGKAPKINVADHAFFQIHRVRPDVGLYVSRAYLSPIVNEPVITLTRRISNPDGRFGGIVVGSVRTGFFRELFAKHNIGVKGSISLVRDDGYLIMRRPHRPDDMDLDLSGNANFIRMGAAPHGHFIGVSGIDGIRRIYNFHHIEGLPLILMVALAEEDVFAEWQHKAISLSILLVLLCTASIGLSLLFRREIMRRLTVEQDLVKAAKRLTQIAATDGLTGVPNRRSFEQVLDREWRRAIRNESSVAVMMLDVDYFKLFNDRYGHQRGDEVLKTVAACMSVRMRRPGDTAARYGGEEFIAILADTDLAGALRVAEAVRETIVALAVPHDASPSGSLTVSIGVAAACPSVGDMTARLVKEADQALYAAKRGGRNRVVGGGASSQLAIVAVEHLSFDAAADQRTTCGD